MYESFKQLNQMQMHLRIAQSTPLQHKLIDHAALKQYLDGLPDDVDAVTAPTPLYEPSFTYEPGDTPNQPAVTMTQFGAKQYTKWLSGITGRQYRLPTEAEWEYAARAGTTTAYSFGDDANDLAKHAWYADNADDQTHSVGTKKPNAWGLCDVHGNVAEWVLDQYDAQHYGTLPKTSDGIPAAESVRWPTALYPRVIRGGCWFDDAEQCRCAARHRSADEDWNTSDPNRPKSPWWFTEYEATGVGLRVVRPLEPLDDTMKKRVWEADIESVRIDVEDRLAEGRGAKAAANERLPGAVGELKAVVKELERARND
jgi:formylglycine-generating enzyme required for sulfatase activity